MKTYYKVFYYRENQPAFWIGQANSKEDAVKKADIFPGLVYDVWLLDEWEDECDSRRGIFSKKFIKNKNNKE
jgi:hypothetical protein